MFAYFPRNDEMLSSMLKHEFEVMAVTEETIKLYFDVNVYDTLVSLSKFSEFEFSFGSNGPWLSFEGLVSDDEWDAIYELEKKGAIMCESKAHTHILARQGFFGKCEEGDYPANHLQYWVKYAINDIWAGHYFKDAVLVHLNDLRLKRLFQKDSI